MEVDKTNPHNELPKEERKSWVTKTHQLLQGVHNRLQPASAHTVLPCSPHIPPNLEPQSNPEDTDSASSTPAHVDSPPMVFKKLHRRNAVKSTARFAKT